MQVNSPDLVRQHRAREARMARLGALSRRKSWVPIRREQVAARLDPPAPPVSMQHDHGFDFHVTAWLVASWARPEIVPAVTVRHILTEVAAFYGMSLIEMLSHRRLKAHTKARQVAMYLAKTLTTKSLPTIGAAIGRDHSTVAHGAEKIEACMASDPGLAAEVEALRLALVGGRA